MNQDILISIDEEICLITFDEAPSTSEFLSFVFREVTKNNICVDMISQTAPTGGFIKFSFTIDDNDLSKMFDICNIVKEKFHSVKPLISGANAKITIASTMMTNEVGFAYKVFDAFRKVNVDTLLVTTSNVDISVLVTQTNALIAKKAIEENLF
jgi:aspartokinase